MSNKKSDPLWTLLGILFKSHPWHGVQLGPEAPELVWAYIEIVPTDTVKYELDKITGHLKVDRPQRYSNICPSLYGLIPQTYCSDRIGTLCAQKTGRPNIHGDGDPLDICVLTEKDLSHGDIMLKARPIGGFRMIDGTEADDKIIAVLEGDAAYGQLRDISECPPALIERLKHYFLTYKEAPGSTDRRCEIAAVYDVHEAHEVIQCAATDYRNQFGDIEGLLTAALRS
jgi:inorganic pyrophosphatase